MRSDRMAEHPIIIRNVSPRGIGARSRGMLPVEGEEVFLRFCDRQMVGRVMWVRGDQFGIHLRDPIDAHDRMPVALWTPAENRTPGFHVFDRFKPVERPWRPGVTAFSKPPRGDQR